MVLAIEYIALLQIYVCYFISARVFDFGPILWIGYRTIICHNKIHIFEFILLELSAAMHNPMNRTHSTQSSGLPDAH